MTEPRVGLFVTCLVDAMRPQIGFAAITLLEAAGCEVVVPTAQTCCGQPAFNSGDDDHARVIARQVVDAFDGLDYLVAPSGSCAGMIKCHLPALLAQDPHYGPRALILAAKTHELLSFLVDIRGADPTPPACQGKATYHDSCSGLRELGIAEQPRALLAKVDGLELVALRDHDVCCGFGGTFCVKYADISDAIVTEKTKAIEASGADILLAGDLGCLMNMAGKLSRQGSKVRCYHTAEMLVGVTDRGIIDTGGDTLNS